MANTEPQQPMTSERREMIWARAENLCAVGRSDIVLRLSHSELCSVVIAYLEDVPDLLAEVERLRAESQNLRAELENLIAAADATHVEAQPYAGVGHTKVVGPFPAALAHARVLLDAQPEQPAESGVNTHDPK